MLSASAIEEHRTAMALPFHDGFLMKPVELDRLSATVARLLQPDAATAPVSGRGVLAALEPSALPDAGEFDALIYLCEIGFARGLRELVTSIAKRDARKRPFADLLLAHLEDLDLGGAMKVLERAQGVNP